MCGICGYIGSTGQHFYGQDVIERMTETLAHRGPDDKGIWTDARYNLALGHRRLSIIDLSREGHQPMLSPSGRYVIVYNGEIYNFGQIRQELNSHDYTWRGHSDTEVILAAFETWGIEAALSRFVGMFAFALWDREQGSLVLARDRMGQKPLYYGYNKGVFLFASELKSILAYPGFAPQTDRDALVEFMRYGYVPAPLSIYKGIYKLPPAVYLHLSAEEIRKKELPGVSKYWDLSDAALEGSRSLITSWEEALRKLDSVLSEAVKLRMISDVPLGSFLSGGIDSSLITALMQSQSSEPVRSFSVGVKDMGLNEANFAGQVAKYLGTEHTELYVSPAEAVQAIHDLPRIYDEPFADPSQVPTCLISRLTRRHVSVCLSGDGGDEVFAGYNRHFWGRNVWERISAWPLLLRKILRRGLLFASPRTWDFAYAAAKPFLPQRLQQTSPGFKLHKLADLLEAADADEFYHRLTSRWQEPEKVAISGIDLSRTSAANNEMPALSDLTLKMQYLDMQTYLPEDILTKVDRASMAVGLEARAPFLDHRVVEFSWRMPLSMKISSGQGKLLLKELLYTYVPKDLVDRPKYSFELPLGDWLRRDLREWAEELLAERKLKEQGYLNPEMVRRVWKEHLSGKANHIERLWNVLMFQSWLQWKG